VNGKIEVESPMVDLYQLWEETSWQLEKRQANPVCVTEEYQSLRKRQLPEYRFNFDPSTIKISTAFAQGVFIFIFITA
jgi:phosphoribosylformylglycinamidine synthase